jgi:hypothetical protein
VTSYGYRSGRIYFNPSVAAPGFSIVDVSTPSLKTRNEYYACDYTVDPNFSEAETFLTGALKSSQVSKSGHASGAQRGESRFDYQALEQMAAPGGAPLKHPVYSFRLMARSQIGKFWTHEKQTQVRHTFFDALNRSPKISISKVGGEYRLKLLRFRHETGAAAPPYDQVSQDAEYVFTSDPCAAPGADPDPLDACSNVYASGLAFLMTEANSRRAFSSRVITYDPTSLLAKETFQWRPSALGVDGLTSLDGSMSSGLWRKTGEIHSRAVQNSWAKVKSLAVTESSLEGVHSVRFYGGSEGNEIAIANNSHAFSVAHLNGEEENVIPEAMPPRFGYFGRWEPGGNAFLTTEIAHTGSRSLKTVGSYGAAVNIPVHDQANAFWNRKKGLMISGWLYMTGQNDNTVNDPRPVVLVEFRRGTALPHHSIDLVGEIEATSPMPYNKWVKVERLVTFDELTQHAATEDSYLRIWFGKAAGACAPEPCVPPPVTAQAMYMDDLRILPADAQVTSFNYDAWGRAESVLDENNDVQAPSYNAFGKILAIKDRKGRAFASTASREFGED